MMLGGRDAAPGASAAVTPAEPAATAPPVAAAPAAAPPETSIADGEPDVAIAKATAPAEIMPAPAAPEVVRTADPATAPDRKPPVRVINIPPGGSILATARALYGKLPGDDDTLLGEIRRLNPDLRDVNVVKAGATVKFPQPTTQTESDGQGSE
jgi:hypothetical protein